jgi:hypothetical protein
MLRLLLAALLLQMCFSLRAEVLSWFFFFFFFFFSFLFFFLFFFSFPDMTRKNNDGLTPADCVLVDQKYITLPFYEEGFLARLCFVFFRG